MPSTVKWPIPWVKVNNPALTMAATEYFAGRSLVIATMHEKESVMAPLLENGLGVNCVVARGLNTDRLGTFSGELERLNDPLETARQKCRMAMELTGCDLAVASEGSFGPHPQLVYVPMDEEIVLLMDRKHNLEIVVREATTDTNFQGMLVRTEQQLRAFADEALFPTHGLIAKRSQQAKDGILKGISDWGALMEAYHAMMRENGQVWLETDMRAMCNPTRMRVIATATEKLLSKARNACPECGVPGFGPREAKPGLPCSWCHAPTQSVLLHVYACAHCAHTDEVKFPHGRAFEDPRYCDHCNP